MNVQVGEFQQKNYCFTDGIGKISKTMAKEICEAHFDGQYTSAFQIRFGGFKGVVGVDPELDASHSLQLRPSMKKFESNHTRLDVLNVAKVSI